MNQEISSVTLSEWISKHHSEEELRSIFLNMDRALKYIHDHNYCIEDFNINNIFILDNRDDCVQFKYIQEMPVDMDSRREIIKKDVFNSAFIQISIYSNTINNIPNITDWDKYISFLKENFDKFAEIIPYEDVPYYRGVIMREASVYYCEYILEKKKRELKELEKEVGEKETSLVDDYSEGDMTNKKVNDIIYRQISGINEAAYLNILVVPVIILLLFIIIMVIASIINFM